MRILLILSLLFVSSDTSSQQMHIVADGNSYVAGNGYTPFSTYVGNYFGLTVQNFGVGGQTTPQMLADQASQVLSTYDPTKINILLVCEIGNHLYYQGNVQNALDTMRLYLNRAKAAGFYTILYTLIHRDQTTVVDNSSTYNAKINQVNAALIADPTYSDFLARIDTVAQFQNYGSGYDADRVHPNNVGQPILANYAIAGINYIINHITIPLKTKVIVQ